jgi:nucleoside-diphosphate-sugar epimerase
VVNNLTGFAYTTGEVFMKSDGTPWRPLVHVEDISRAFVALLGADRSVVHDKPFNVGATAENYQIRDVAKIVEEVVPGSRIVLADSAGPDLRNYRVNCDKLADAVDFECLWTVRRGVEQLYAAYQAAELTLDDLEGSRYLRIARVKELLADDRIDTDLRWVAA